MELRWGYLVLYMVAVPLYVLLTIAAPTEVAESRYHLSPTSILLLKFTIIIPIVLIWLAALKGVSMLKEYTVRLGHAAERPAMDLVLRGLQVLVLGLIITTLSGALRSYALDKTFFPAYQIVNNYLRIIFPLAGLYYTYLGSRKLLGARGLKGVAGGNIMRTCLLSLVGVGIIAAMVYTNPSHNASPDPQTTSFYMNDLLIAMTILVPNFLVWVCGGLSVSQLRKYSGQLPAGGYKDGFARLAGSVTVIIAISVGLQILFSLSVALTRLNLGLLLLIVYVLLIGYALAYMMLASSARKLCETSDLSPPVGV